MAPERIGDDVARELRRLGPAGGMADVVAAWPLAVGDAIARNAWPARVARDGTLHVATTSAAWAFELAQLAPTIAERLGEVLGSLSPARLRFAPGRVPEPSAPVNASDEIPAIAATPDERALAERLVAGAGNVELRTLIARAAAASLARRPSDR